MGAVPTSSLRDEPGTFRGELMREGPASSQRLAFDVERSLEAEEEAPGRSPEEEEV